jgi:hypothetical protein
MVENDYYLHIPEPLREVIEKTFLNFYDSYLTLAEANSIKNNTPMMVSI